MKKRMTLTALCLFLFFGIQSYAATPQEVVAVGKAVGIDVQCSGLMVVGFSEDSPAKESGLHRGDLIIKVDGEPVETPASLRSMLQEKQQVTLTALRQQREQSFLVRPKQADGLYQIGANVKAEMAGIGTITYYDPATSVFGAFGHGITDAASSKLFPIREGFICKATVIAVEKGTNGAPGMLQGSFDSSTVLGAITRNTPSGIFGTLSSAPDGEEVSVADRGEITTGDAEILCNVNGDQVEHYSVKINRHSPYLSITLHK